MAETISQIYDRYQVLPALQLHMLRVAAVAQLICSSHHRALPTDHIISCCLLHDIGNILKFDLTYYPEFLEPEGVAYRQQVKDSFSQYGSTEQQATLTIANELTLSSLTMSLLRRQIGESLHHNTHTDSLSVKVCEYADMRTGPHGVMSLSERIDDRETRNLHNKGISPEEAAMATSSLKQDCRELEAVVLSDTTLTATQINDQHIQEHISPLRQFILV